MAPKMMVATPVSVKTKAAFSSLKIIETVPGITTTNPFRINISPK
jgi:hypothetical protein